jgi:hypothetical protein
MGRKRRSGDGIIETCMWSATDGIIKNRKWSVRKKDVTGLSLLLSVKTKWNRKKRREEICACSVDNAAGDQEALSPAELDAVACIDSVPLEPCLTLASYGCRKETHHTAFNGHYFTVRDLLDVLGEHETATRGYWMGSIDKRNTRFEGLTSLGCSMTHGRYMLAWGPSV